MEKYISIFITQYFVFLAWIAFRVQNIEYLTYSLQKYVLLDFQYVQTLEIISTHKFAMLILILFMLLHFISYRKGNLIEKISTYNLKIWFIILIAISLSIVFFHNGNPEDFVYFKF